MHDSNLINMDSETLKEELKKDPQNAEIAFRLSMVTDTNTYMPLQSVEYVIQAIQNDRSRSRKYKYFNEYMTRLHDQFVKIVNSDSSLYGLNNKYVRLLKSKGLNWGMENYSSYIGEYSLVVHLYSYCKCLYSVTFDDGHDMDIKGIKLPEYEEKINEIWNFLVRDSFFHIRYSTNIDFERCDFSFMKSFDEKNDIINQLYKDFGLAMRLIYIMEDDKHDFI